MPRSFFGEEEQKQLEGGIAEAMDLDGESQQEETSEETTEDPTAKSEQLVKIGEREYSQEDLQELVGLGERAREVGDSHGGFDKYVSEFGKKSQRIGELKKELEAVKNPIAQDGGLTDEATQQAKDAARKLGIVLTDDIKDMVGEILKSEFDNQYSARRSGEKLLEEVQGLEKQIDGTDGRPKFEAEKVLEFMQENRGFTDPQKAYEAMNLDKMAEWRANQILSKRRSGITTDTGTRTNKMPQEVSVNKENLHDLMREALNT